MAALKRNPAHGGNRGGARQWKRLYGANSITPAENLLSRLDGARQVGAGRWMALCPAHEDRRPSLSIRETEDSRILLHCFSGCGAADVLSSIGMSLSALFPTPIGHHLPKAKATFPALPVLRALALESSIVFYCGAALLAGEPFDSARLRIAIERIDAGLRVAEGRA